MDKKISELNLATALTGNESVAVVQGVETKKVTVSNLRPYKIYRAIVSQTGTDAPTAIVLENTYGQVPVYSYSNIGRYFLTFTGNVLTDNKTIPSEASSRLNFNRLIIEDGSGGTTLGYGIRKHDTNVIQINTFSDIESMSDDVLNGNLIEIITYN